jgi:hypothetical protein
VSVVAPTWRDDPDEVAPTVLLLGGFLTSPPFYARMRGQLLDRGAAGVVVAPIWLPDWLLVPARGYGAIVARSGRALVRAAAMAAGSSASRGAPLLVVGHSAGGITARILTSPEPFDGRRLDASKRIGAIVTLGTPHRVAQTNVVGQGLARLATAFADTTVPGAAFAPTTGYLAVTSRFVTGQTARGVRDRVGYRLSLSLHPGADLDVGLHPDPDAVGDLTAIEGDGLVPCRSAHLDGAENLVLEGIAHGQLGGAPWYGSAVAIDVWWPRAVAIWRTALHARTAYTSTSV